MRRLLNSKLSIIALVVGAVVLISGVALAATSAGPNSSVSNQEGTGAVAIFAIPLEVPAGGTLQVVGAGFEAGETVLFQIVTGLGPPIFLQGGQTNDAGAFLADASANSPTGRLPETLVPGIYTIRALSGFGDHVASAPLVVCEPDESGSKCAE